MRFSPLAITVSILLLAAPPPPALAQDGGITDLNLKQRAVYDHAVDAFRAQHYAAAFGRFAELADAGHAPSARLALVMLQNGPALFGAEWSASLDQQRRWNAMVVNSGRLHMAIVGRTDQE